MRTPFLPEAIAAPLARGMGLPPAERREVVVLYARLPGLSALSTRLPAEELQGLLGRIVRTAMGVAQRHGGTWDKSFDETLMLVFGAPSAVADAARAAVLAAFELRRELADVDLSLSPACALQQGLAVAGVIGTSSRRSYTVIGDAANTAHRLLLACLPGEVIAGGELLRALGTFATTLRIDRLAPLPAKGKQAPLVRARIAMRKPLEEGMPAHAGDRQQTLALIDGLEAPAPAWLTAVALLQHAPATASAATAGLSQDELAHVREAVGELKLLIHDEQDDLAFADPAVGEALVARLVRNERERLHRRAAAALAELGRAEEALVHEVIGAPAEASHVAAAALAARRLAAGDARAALRFLGERRADERVPPRLEARLRILQARALRRLGHEEEARELLIRSAGAAGAGAQLEPLLELEATLRHEGQTDRAAGILELAERAGGGSARANAHLAAARCRLALDRGELDEGRRQLERLELLLRLLEHPGLALRAQALRARMDAESRRAGPAAGDLAEALLLLGASLKKAEKAADARLEAVLRRMRARLLLEQGTLRAAEDESRRSLQAALRQDDSLEIGLCCRTLSEVAAAAGKEHDAATFAMQGREILGMALLPSVELRDSASTRSPEAI